MEPNKCIHYENIYSNVSYDSFKFNGSSKIKVLHQKLKDFLQALYEYFSSSQKHHLEFTKLVKIIKIE